VRYAPGCFDVLEVLDSHYILRRHDRQRRNDADEARRQEFTRSAVAALARKLRVLLHKLWESVEVYEPLQDN
jgi:hypothetical protein